MLNSLPTSWEPKVTTIEESKDLDSLFLNKLIGSLLTYEMKINYNTKEIKEVPKKVGVAFKSTTCEKAKKRGSIKQKLKAHIATLSDEDSLENEDQEVANLCLMTIDDIKFSITMVVTEKCDVYSFGMVALETLMEKHLEEVLPWLSSPTYLVNMKLIDVLGNRLPLLTD
ncbi:hypothetical protein Godav_022335, partial [Gossypium davidsonii]|nr:hypothetical protein [Gossypium davidsonii]